MYFECEMFLLPLYMDRILFCSILFRSGDPVSCARGRDLAPHRRDADRRLAAGLRPAVAFAAVAVAAAVFAF